jgi:sporulation protein YlmC with PRC-barrel domain
MLLYAEKIIGAKAEHEAAPLNDHKVNDVLFNKYDHQLCYFTYSTEKRGDKNERLDLPGDEHMETIVAATSGIGTPNTPMTGSAYPETHEYVKETFYIPWHQVVNIDEEKLVFEGNERQKEEPQECYSFMSVKDWTVIDQNGEKVGKIKDLVLDTDRQQVVGFLVTEGFWKKLIGSDDKYMPITGAPNWASQEWKIEHTPDLILKDKAEQL